MKKFTCSYYHDRVWWSLILSAYDWEDARVRAAMLGRLRVDGEIIATISSWLGGKFTADILCFFANMFKLKK